MKTVGIVVLNYNGKQDTHHCLKSLEALTYPKLEIILVDNDSADGSPEYFQTHFPSITLIQTGQNKGYAGGNNVGIAYGQKLGCDYIVLLNNDTKVSPQFVEHLIKPFTQDQSVGIVGSWITRMDKPHLLDHLGGVWDQKRLEFNFIGYKLPTNSPLPQMKLDYVCGAAICIKKEVFEAIGHLDERFFLFWEEGDFCMRAKQAHFQIRVAKEAVVQHKGSASFENKKAYATYFNRRNRLLWIERNCSQRQWIKAISKTITIQLPYFALIFLLRSIQLQIQKLLKKPTHRNQKRIIHLKASILAITDYLLRYFGAGNSHKLSL